MPDYANVAEESQLSDHSLMRRFRLGSEDAATQIYLRYAHRLRALTRVHSSPDLARYVDAEEMVQSVFGSFFRRAKNGYYEVPEGEELWRLFLVIALNKIRTKGAHYRAAKRDIRKTADGALLETCSPVVQGDEAAEMQNLQLMVHEALEALPPEQREMVMLRIEGYRVDEIADRTRRSKRSVERILQAARKRLAYYIDEA
jgi:RNA polymerase sigma-70 factor (ECF subfamily)